MPGCRFPLAVLLALALGAATSDGVRLHHLEAGSDPSIVLQPGWTTPAEIREPQITSFRVVAIDPRSQGREIG